MYAWKQKKQRISKTSMVSCEICGKQFSKLFLKKQHLVYHFKEKLLANIKTTLSDSIENDLIYECPYIECQYKSSNKYKTLRHYGVLHNIVDTYLKDHLTSNQTVLPIESSGQSEDFQANLFQDQEEQCPLCERVFQSKQGLGK